MEVIFNNLNEYFQSFQPWQLVVGTALAVHLVHFGLKILKSALKTNWKAASFRWFRQLPFIRGKIDQELNKTVQEMETEMSDQIAGRDYHRTLPEKGWSKDQILSEIDDVMDLGEFKAENGSLSGTCHKEPDEQRVKTVTEAYSKTAFANPLNPDAFPGIRKMEAEVVRMCCNLFNGDPDSSCGTMTSGGTESLILASKAYREYGKKTKGISKPNIIMPQSGHVGFVKAAELMNMDITYIPLLGDKDLFNPDMKKFEAAINKNTVMLVASAPQYPQGLIDPIKAIGALALKYNIPMHVDACLGGFLLAFADQCGLGDLEHFDFRVPGVTSISADTHKFGYAPKGSSVIMYKDKKYIHCQYFVSIDWSGGIFVSPTMAGSRSGGIIAATWASLMNHGQDGYVKASQGIFDTLAFIVNGIRNIKGLTVMGDPKVCIVAFRSDNMNVYCLADEMKKKGWLLGAMQYPICVHLYITPMHTQDGIKEKFLRDLTSVTQELLKQPNKKLDGRAAIYGMAQKIPDPTLVEEIAENFIDVLYTTK